MKDVVCVDVVEVLSVLKLPDGLRLKNWTESNPDGFWIASQSSELASSPIKAERYFETTLIGVERISDGKVSTFEVVGLALEGMQTKIVRLYDLAHALDQAIAELR